MGTNPNNLVGTNGAYGGRTSVNAFNDVLSAFTTAGVVSGWNCAPQSGMTIQLGGDSLSRDVAIAEDPFGNRTTINNREGEPVPVEISAASATTQRIDCVVAYVNSPATVQSTTLDNPEAVGLIDVKGSASSEPDDEAIRAAITADGGTGSTAYYVILATITVPAGATSITDSEIAQGAATMTKLLENSVKSNNIDWAIQTITKEQYFQSVTNPYTIGDCYIYKFGPFINIQRLVVNNTAAVAAGGSADFGVVKPEYCPKMRSNKYLKFSVDKNSYTANSYGHLTANLSNTGFRIANTTNSSYNNNFYMHGIVYMTDE